MPWPRDSPSTPPIPSAPAGAVTATAPATSWPAATDRTAHSTRWRSLATTGWSGACHPSPLQTRLPVWTAQRADTAPRPLPSADRGHLGGERVHQPLHLGHGRPRSEEHTSELQSPCNLVCRLLLEKKNAHKQVLWTQQAHRY